MTGETRERERLRLSCSILACECTTNVTLERKLIPEWKTFLYYITARYSCLQTVTKRPTTFCYLNSGNPGKPLQQSQGTKFIFSTENAVVIESSYLLTMLLLRNAIWISLPKQTENKIKSISLIGSPTKKKKNRAQPTLPTSQLLIFPTNRCTRIQATEKINVAYNFLFVMYSNLVYVTFIFYLFSLFFYSPRWRFVLQTEKSSKYNSPLYFLFYYFIFSVSLPAVRISLLF